MAGRAQQKDTDADRQLYDCINATPPRSFLMIAGAGSGKTTSLIKGLNQILKQHGEALKLRRQKVACITYTEIAAGEIWADVSNNPLVHVATIHSFFWSLIRSFQTDIQAWVKSRIQEKLVELRAAAENFGPRVQQRTRDKNQADILRYEQQLGRISRVRSFTYGTGSDYVNGILGHDDIIKIVPQLLTERPLMRSLLVQQYPFLFVDESQDTMERVVAALKAVDEHLGDKFCLGFFGDPMQKIYATGIGAITAEAGWANIEKPENFRCPRSVLDVANGIRRDGDGLVQTRGRMSGPEAEPVSVPGTARIVILPIDEERDRRIADVRRWVARQNNDPAWDTANGDHGVKVLVIVHKMAAKRLGFGDLHAALNEKAPEKFKNGFQDGTAWPLRPFVSFVMPLVRAGKAGNSFEVMQILRAHSPLLARDKLAGVDIAARLKQLHGLTEQLFGMMEPGSHATIGEVLSLLHTSGLIDLDPRLLSYLNFQPPPQETVPKQAEDDDGEDLTKEIAAMDAFLACPAPQFWGYDTYINDGSPFSTQQGIKGAEFERVLVILDDDEGTHNQFSYDKYLGIKALSDRDLANQREGKETTVDRTRRLFYVCCTRAMQDLVVVLFTSDVALAVEKVTSLGLFASGSIHLEADLGEE